ncbi:hypothetical protein [Streptomyces calidiresistens]|uniref:Uncharacterized protein n=1 Tax=Streptomyces calidiresistens TaxID=1485586 RepID=A0A7W3XW36_9ACTN|nr:hypothetical protein [Streptomyces calidiresistens]MBB0229371.1 hypothetical protein [Streptomyces calidiresistens]
MNDLQGGCGEVLFSLAALPLSLFSRSHLPMFRSPEGRVFDVHAKSNMCGSGNAQGGEG